MTMLDRLRPPAKPKNPPARPDAARELIEASIDADAAALGLSVALDRRRDAISAAIAAGTVSSALGKRMLSRAATERALAATPLALHAGQHRSASSRRLGCLGQAQQILNRPKTGD